MSHANRLQFESVLEAANDAVLACEEARRESAALAVHVSADADSAEAALASMIRVVACLCDVPIPEPVDDHSQLARWTMTSIVNMKATAVRHAAQARCTLDHEAIAASLDLIHTLNKKLGGDAP